MLLKLNLLREKVPSLLLGETPTKLRNLPSPTRRNTNKASESTDSEEESLTDSPAKPPAKYGEPSTNIILMVVPKMAPLGPTPNLSQSSRAFYYYCSHFLPRFPRILFGAEASGNVLYYNTSTNK